jgi:hypothetical protein
MGGSINLKIAAQKPENYFLKTQKIININYIAKFSRNEMFFWFTQG